MATQGPNLPTSGTNVATVGTAAWTNPGNITLDDGSIATSNNVSGGTTTTNYLRGSTYGFGIPTTATINGIEVVIKRSRNASEGNVIDSTISIVKADGSVGTTNKAVGGIWPGALTNATYGGSSDLWGETWAPADINDTDFGVVVSASLSAAVSVATQARVDVITIKVYYTIPNTAGYATVGSSIENAGSASGVNNPTALLTTIPGGTVSMITAYVNMSSTTRSTTCRIRAGSAGSRGSILGITNSSNVTSTPAWVDFTFSVPYVAASNTYWLEFTGYGGDGGGTSFAQTRYDTGGATDTGYITSDINNPLFNTNQYSIYATYTPNAVGGWTMKLV